MTPTRELRPEEKRVLIAGLAGMQPPLPSFRPGIQVKGKQWLWMLLGAGLGWFALGALVLSIAAWLEVLS
jgi:hypothetical protein